MKKRWWYKNMNDFHIFWKNAPNLFGNLHFQAIWTPFGAGKWVLKSVKNDFKLAWRDDLKSNWIKQQKMPKTVYLCVFGAKPTRHLQAPKRKSWFQRWAQNELTCKRENTRITEEKARKYEACLLGKTRRPPACYYVSFTAETKNSQRVRSLAR